LNVSKINITRTITTRTNLPAKSKEVIKWSLHVQLLVLKLGPQT
jgi:hypothetical protein